MPLLLQEGRHRQDRSVQTQTQDGWNAEEGQLRKAPGHYANLSSCFKSQFRVHYTGDFLSSITATSKKRSCVCCCHLVAKWCDSATPWTVACPAPLSMGFLRQEYWSGLPATKQEKGFFNGGGVGVHRLACGILVPWPEIKPRPPALEPWSLKH